MKPPDEKETPRAEAERAAKDFGLQLDGLTESDVVREYRRAIRLAHPDTGASPDEASTLIHGARYRRAVLLRWLSEQPDPTCEYPGCDGSGWISAGNGRIRPCPNCGE